MAKPAAAAKASPIEQFGKLSLANKALVTLLVMALCAVAFYVLFYQDADSAIAKAKGEKQTLEKTLSEYQIKLRNKQQFQEEIRQLEKKRRTALEKLPADAEIPNLLSKIHGQAKIVGLDIKDFERLPEATKGFYAAIPVLMTLDGTYAQIATFFYYVGKLTRIVNLTNIELKAEGADATADPVMLQARVLATTFRYQRADESAPKGKAAAKAAQMAAQPTAGGGH